MDSKPKFVVDVCAGQMVAGVLKGFGLDVKSIVEINPKMDDADILAIAKKENRILVTTDKDFGELVFKSLMSHAGVLLLRLQDESGLEKKKSHAVDRCKSFA